MVKVQRYIFWIIGLGLICQALYQFTISIVLQYQNVAGVTGETPLLNWIGTIGWSVGNMLYSLAIAMLCLLAARVCKLEEDPSFKDDLSRVIRNLRKMGRDDD